MLRFLKYIFLIFGGLALSIMIFFLIQNKEDLAVAWEYKSELSYQKIEAECQKDDLYLCFLPKFVDYSEKVSITGLSLGLKLAFNFVEELKDKTTKEYKDIYFALKFLELNNIVISRTNSRFHGFKNLYGGYIGKMMDFLESAKKFSDNLIIGLTKSDEGLDSVKNPELKKRFIEQFEKIQLEYKKQTTKIQLFIDSEVKLLKDKYE